MKYDQNVDLNMGKIIARGGGQWSLKKLKIFYGVLIANLNCPTPVTAQAPAHCIEQR